MSMIFEELDQKGINTIIEDLNNGKEFCLSDEHMAEVYANYNSYNQEQQILAELDKYKNWLPKVKSKLELEEEYPEYFI